MNKGYLVNDFGERLGKYENFWQYDYKHRHEYYVCMYGKFVGYKTKLELMQYAIDLDLYFEEVED